MNKLHVDLYLSIYCTWMVNLCSHYSDANIFITKVYPTSRREHYINIYFFPSGETCHGMKLQVCEKNGGHLPLYKQYQYMTLSREVVFQELAIVFGLMNMMSGLIGFGDITFIGLSRAVRPNQINELCLGPPFYFARQHCCRVSLG